jgi:predicted amidohydrolase YtcJ
MTNDAQIDLLLRAGAIHTTIGGPPARAIAISAGRIAAVAPDRDGLDELAGRARQIIDDPDLFVLPALYDTHNHLGEMIRNLAGGGARCTSRP